MGMADNFLGGFFDGIFTDSAATKLKKAQAEEELARLREAQALRASGVNYLSGYRSPEEIGATPDLQQQNLLSAAVDRNLHTANGLDANGKQLATRRVTSGGLMFGYDNVPTDRLNAAAFPVEAAQRARTNAFPGPIKTVALKPGEQLRNEATGEPVGAPVPSLPEKPDLSPLAKAKADYMSGRLSKNEYEAIFRKETERAPTPQKDTFGEESKLRAEFDTKAAPFAVVRDAYAGISNIADNPSAASDISLVYQFMKMQDPGSTVREGEYATAENASGVSERIRGMFNKVKDGQFLTPSQRKDFVNQASKLYATRLKSYKQDEDRYAALARNYGIDPVRVIYDRTGGIVPTTQKTPSIGHIEDGYSFKGGDPAKPENWIKVN